MMMIQQRLFVELNCTTTTTTTTNFLFIPIDYNLYQQTAKEEI